MRQWERQLSGLKNVGVRDNGNTVVLSETDKTRETTPPEPINTQKERAKLAGVSTGTVARENQIYSIFN